MVGFYEEESEIEEGFKEDDQIRMDILKE